MTGARKRALLILIVLALAGVGAAALALRHSETRPAAERPPLLLLTSLPILFGEGFSLDGAGSPVLAALEQRYRVVPISVSAPAELAKGRSLLMAQPRAQRPEDLVALDQWVRDGGRVLLLADPMLEWPSERPLGDPLRPPPMFADTGLLAHWGLRLDTPEQRGPVERALDGQAVLAASPGALFGKTCRISKDRFVAQCRIGEGQATIVADADFLNSEGVDGADRNIDSLLNLLANLDSR